MASPIDPARGHRIDRVLTGKTATPKASPRATKCAAVRADVSNICRPSSELDTRGMHLTMSLISTRPKQQSDVSQRRLNLRCSSAALALIAERLGAGRLCLAGHG